MRGKKKPTTKFERDGLPTAVLDVREAAAYLAVSESVLYRMVRAGEVPHTRVGSAIRFRVEDLDRYLEENTSRDWHRVDERGRPQKRPAKKENSKSRGKRASA